MTRDIPIIFSAPMVRALMEGRKTMTRRLAVTSRKIKEESTATSYRSTTKIMDSPWKSVKPGDRLWVREAVAYIDNSEFDAASYWQYRADTNGREFPGDWPPEEVDNPDRPRWKPSIHMPREASRLTLIVNGVKIERLQEISKADAIAEGAAARPNCSGFRAQYDGWSMDWSRVGEFSPYATGGAGPLQERDISLATAQSAFGEFINVLHGGERWNMPGKMTPIWDQNPFVVATTFRVIKANIDAPEARIAA